MPDVPRRVSLVVGAAGGIGSALCRRLAEQGNALIVADLGADIDGTGADPAPLQNLSATLPDDTRAEHIDITEASSAEHLIDLAYASHGRLDSVACLVGFSYERTLVRTSSLDLRRVLRTHLEAPLMLLQAASIRWQSEHAPGSVVLASSPSAFFGVARQTALSAAGAGIIAAVRSAAVELHRRGIRINAVAPTARTRLTEHLPLFQGIAQDSLSPTPVAELIAFLLSPEAGDITGETLGVAGQRIYALQSRETPGVFTKADVTIETHWDAIVRG